jgi:hypothetical protein
MREKLLEQQEMANSIVSVSIPFSILRDSSTKRGMARELRFARFSFKMMLLHLSGE